MKLTQMGLRPVETAARAFLPDGTANPEQAVARSREVMEAAVNQRIQERCAVASPPTWIELPGYEQDGVSGTMIILTRDAVSIEDPALRTRVQAAVDAGASMTAVMDLDW